MTVRVLPGPATPAGQVHGAQQEQRGVTPPNAGRSPFWKRGSQRLKVFLVVFLVTILIGLGLLLLKTPIYQATGTVEIRPSDDPAQADGPVDFQFLLTQVQTITSRSMLERVIEQLGGDIVGPEGVTQLNALEDSLSAEPVQGTALVRITAIGEDPQMAALSINTLIDVYGDQLRRKRLARRSGSSAALGRQAASLKRTIIEKQRQLALFQQRYDITSLEREENDVLTRVKALADGRDKAEARARETEAALEQVEAAVANGELVLLPADKKLLAALSSRIALMRGELRGRAKIFTKRHMALDPAIRKIRENLKVALAQRAALEKSAREDTLITVRQARDQAASNLRRVEAELERHKAAAKLFSARFQQFKSINTELAELQKRHQKVRNNVTRLDLNRAAATARMEVLEAAKPPNRPAHTQYLRDGGLVLGAALLLGLFAVWLVEFLGRSRAADSGPTTKVSVELTNGARLAAPMMAAAPALDSERSAQEAIAAPAARLTGQPATEVEVAATPVPAPVATSALENEAGDAPLSAAQLQALWDASEGDSRLLLALLFNGCGPQELLQLKGGDLDLQGSELGIGERIVPLSPVLHDLLTGLGELGAEQPLLSDELAETGAINALLSCTAIDAGLPQPMEVDAPRLQRSYLAWLVAQGARLSELKRVAGPLSPTYLASFAAWSPSGPSLTLEEIDPFLPFLVPQAA